VRRLGEVECRECGAVGAGSSLAAEAGAGAVVVGDGSPPGLAEEVEQALARVLRPPRPLPTGSALSAESVG
jgi:hypothetical protein